MLIWLLLLIHLVKMSFFPNGITPKATEAQPWMLYLVFADGEVSHPFYTSPCSIRSRFCCINFIIVYSGVLLGFWSRENGIYYLFVAYVWFFKEDNTIFITYWLWFMRSRVVNEEKIFRNKSFFLRNKVQTAKLNFCFFSKKMLHKDESKY